MLLRFSKKNFDFSYYSLLIFFTFFTYTFYSIISKYYNFLFTCISIILFLTFHFSYVKSKEKISINFSIKDLLFFLFLINSILAITSMIVAPYFFVIFLLIILLYPYTFCILHLLLFLFENFY